jgi:phosphatidate cytidylyltransferase
MTSEKNKLISNNLFLRIISALVAVLILIGTLYFFKITGALFLILVISALICFEFTNMFFDHDLIFKYLTPLMTTLSLWFNFQNPDSNLKDIPLLIGVVAIPWIYRNVDIQITFDKLIVYMLIVFYSYFLPIQIFEIFKLDSNFIHFFFFAILVFGIDTCAYFSGKIFGRKFFKSQFQPKISPSKTLEGFLGSLVWPAILIAIFQQLKIFEFTSFSVFLLYITSFASISGDLIASLIKRKSQKKDSGQLFIGHGGFLDRLDSLLLSAPLFLIAAKYFTAF